MLTGRYTALDARSYFLNGRMYHKAEGAVLGHVLLLDLGVEEAWQGLGEHGPAGLVVELGL